jgi:hypothetical protein
MMDYGPVKMWLEVVQRRMNDMFNKSNLYQSLPLLYAASVSTRPGQWLCLMTTRTLSAQCSRSAAILANSARGSVDTCFRKFSMTVRQLVAEFGLDNVSSSVKGMFDAGNYEEVGRDNSRRLPEHGPQHGKSAGKRQAV